MGKKPSYKKRPLLQSQRGFLTSHVMLALFFLASASVAGYALFQSLITHSDLTNSHSTRSILTSTKAQLLTLQADPDGEGLPELLKESSSALPASFPGQKTDAWGRTFRYCTWDPGIANANATYSQNNTAPPLSNLIGRVISAGKDGTFQTACLTATAVAGDDLLIDIYTGDALHYKLYQGQDVSQQTRGYNAVVYSATEPTNKYNGLLWYDTANAVTKMWNGSSWISQGAAAPTNNTDIANKSYVDTAVASAGSSGIDELRLTTNIASWTTAGAANWTVPAGVSKIYVTLVGGGGGGGGPYNNPGGGGGAAGGYLYKAQVSVTAGDVLTITVGTGGVGTNTNGASGTAGGSTTLAKGSTVYLVAMGGRPGLGATFIGNTGCAGDGGDGIPGWSLVAFAGGGTSGKNGKDAVNTGLSAAAGLRGGEGGSAGTNRGSAGGGGGSAGTYSTGGTWAAGSGGAGGNFCRPSSTGIVCYSGGSGGGSGASIPGGGGGGGAGWGGNGGAGGYYSAPGNPSINGGNGAGCGAGGGGATYDFANVVRGTSGNGYQGCAYIEY